MRAVVALATIVAALALPAVAGAAMKVQAPPKVAICGTRVELGVRAPVGTKGSHVVRVKALDGATGSAWYSHRTMATRHWKRWSIAAGQDGRCTTTTIVYSGKRADGSRWVKRFKVLFRDERL